MKRNYDYIIIGGGIIGLSVAYNLSKKGANNILLLEKDFVGEGSTGKCAGGIRLQFSTDINIRFSILSRKIFDNFKEEFGVDPEFKKVGYLFLATEESELSIFEKNIALQRKFGIDVELLTQKEIKKRWPYLKTDDIKGGTFCAQDGYAGPYEVVQGYMRAIRRLKKVDIMQKEEVIGIDFKNNLWKVKTKKEYFNSPLVINCGGPYARNIANMAKINIPISPIRRQIFVTEPFDMIKGDIPLTIDLARGWYFRREGKGILMAGPQDEKESFNTTTDFEGMTYAAENGVYRVPIFSSCRFATSWAGLYEISPDSHAIMGEVEGNKGFYIAAGFSGHGFQHAPSAGLLMAELILEGNAHTIDITPLSPSRFAKGRLIKESLTAFKE